MHLKKSRQTYFFIRKREIEKIFNEQYLLSGSAISSNNPLTFP